MLVKVKKKQSNSSDCIVCGENNPNSVKASFYSMEDGTCACLFRFKPTHQSYPSRAHGGMIAAIIDETIGRAVWVEDESIWGVTVKINVEFHAPCPYDEDLVCVGKIMKHSRLFFDGVAEIYDKSGKLLDRGYATYMVVPLEQAIQSSFSGEHKEGVTVYVEDGINEIDLPEIKALRKLD